MNAPVIDLASFPLVVRGPFGKKGEPPHVRLRPMERGACDAIGKALGLPPTVTVVTRRLDDDDAFRKSTLGLIWSGDSDGLTEVRIRINGIVKRAGVEHVGVSLVCLAGDQIIGRSEDLGTPPGKSGALLLADARHQVAPISEAVRAAAAGQKAAAPASPKKAKPAAPPVTVLVADSAIRSVDVSPDGKWLATTHWNQHLTVWDAATGKACWSKRAGGAGMQFVQSAAFSPDSKRVATGASSVTVFDVASGAPLEGPAGHPKGELVQVQWTPEFIATVSAKNVRGADTSVALWQASGKLVQQWKWELPRRIAFLPGKPLSLLVGGYKDDRQDKSLWRVEVKTGVVAAAQPVKSSWFVLADEGVWVESGDDAQLLDPKTLEPLKTALLGGDRLLAVGGASLFAANGSKVRRRDERGKIVAEWSMPKIDGLQAHIEALEKGGADVGVRGDRANEVVDLRVSPRGDRIVVATGIALQVWTADGSPVLMASIGGG